MINIFLQEIYQPMLLVHSETGVTYTHQCDGHSCSQHAATGFLIPLADPRDYPLRDDLPIKKVMELTERYDRCHTLFGGLIELLPKVMVFVNDNWYQLTFDTSRSEEVVEAWVPVRCGSVKNPATLIWENSD